MKSFFFQGIIGFVVLMGGGYFLWMLMRAIVGMIADRREQKDLAVLKAESHRRRNLREAENRARLSNGCQHAFESGFGAFPRGVCSKCGLEREKPQGDCDHRWRSSSEPWGGSNCEKCGKVYRGIT